MRRDIVDATQGHQFELDWVNIPGPHTVVGLYDRRTFLLFRPVCGGMGLSDCPGIVNFRFGNEERFLQIDGYALQLHPRPLLDDVLHYEQVFSVSPDKNYRIERAYAGARMVRSALGLTGGFELYRDLIDAKKLVVERDAFGRLGEKIGMWKHHLMWNPVRIAL